MLKDQNAQLKELADEADYFANMLNEVLEQKPDVSNDDST